MLSHHIALALADENQRNLTPDSRKRVIVAQRDREAQTIAADMNERVGNTRESASGSGPRRFQGRLRRLVSRSQSSLGS
jgi:hypothetical protein